MFSLSTGASSITSLSSVALRRNETLIVVGHEDGSIATVRLAETVTKDDSLPEPSFTLNQFGSVGSMKLPSGEKVALAEPIRSGGRRLVAATDGMSGKIYHL